MYVFVRLFTCFYGESSSKSLSGLLVLSMCAFSFAGKGNCRGNLSLQKKAPLCWSSFCEPLEHVAERTPKDPLHRGGMSLVEVLRQSSSSGRWRSKLLHRGVFHVYTPFYRKYTCTHAKLQSTFRMFCAILLCGKFHLNF